jgi:glutamine synthetase
VSDSNASGTADLAEWEAFAAAHPELKMFEVLMPDMNGILRCKRLQRDAMAGLFRGEQKSPITLPLITPMGEYCFNLDADDLGGERDVKLCPIPGTLAVIDWLDSPTGQVMATHNELDGSPCWVDGRHALASILDMFEAKGLKPVIATEMEFYMVAPGEGPQPKPLLGKIPGTNLEQQGTQYVAAQDLWQFDGFLDDLRSGCENQNIPLTTLHAEFSPGQWEVNTRHGADILKVCDDTALLKRLVKGMAHKHGIATTFMAKPFADIPGSGMHLHLSLYNEAGDNLFAVQDSAEPAISDSMRHAIGGVMATMAEASLMFAPNANSYRRFAPGKFVPLEPSWGYNHREVAVRIPLSDGNNRRFEHRVAGADANPYLLAAAVLAGVLHGLENAIDPGAMVAQESDYEATEHVLPQRWEAAIDLFSTSIVMPRYLGERFTRAYASARRDEAQSFHSTISNIDYQWYFRSV